MAHLKVHPNSASALNLFSSSLTGRLPYFWRETLLRPLTCWHSTPWRNTRLWGHVEGLTAAIILDCMPEQCLLMVLLLINV